MLTFSPINNNVECDDELSAKVQFIIFVSPISPAPSPHIPIAATHGVLLL